jgi:hypothetical protein
MGQVLTNSKVEEIVEEKDVPEELKCKEKL